MSVQAQQLPFLGGEHKSRPIEFAGNLDMGVEIDSRAFIFPASFNNGVLIEECQQQVFLGGAVVDNMQRIVSQGTSPVLPFQGLVVPNFSHNYQQPAPVMTAECAPMPASASRKRRKESVDRCATQMQAQQALAGGISVSTGLRLALDDEGSTLTSSRPSSTRGSASSLTLGDEVAVQFSMHQEDLNQLLKSQAEQLRQALEERTRTQANTLMASIEGEMARKMKEKEVEMERVSRRNAELEERVRQLSMEREVWQGKAKSNEAMVAMLRGHLQQAMVQAQHQSCRDASRAEGCGDSEEDDAVSVYIDENPRPVQMMRPSHILSGMGSLHRACRLCGANEACVLLLPCLHLCLCVQCNQTNPADRCPVCCSLVSNSAQVYLS